MSISFWAKMAKLNLEFVSDKNIYFEKNLSLFETHKIIISGNTSLLNPTFL